MRLQIDKYKKELKSHGSYEFPVHVSYETLLQYERGSFQWHWHPEIELTYILDGEIEYQINDTIYHLKTGDGLFCNSNALHTGKMRNNENCIYLSVTFHPRVIYGFPTSLIASKYVTAILENPLLASCSFTTEIPWQGTILEYLAAIYQLSLHPTAVYELQLQLILGNIWLELYAHCTHLEAMPSASDRHQMERLRVILSYLHDHYMEKITLDDIARRSNLSKSECCRFFRKHMHQSLFDYLLFYRIEKSLPLLSENELNITEISNQVGFSSPAYFSKIFRAQMHCSPREYRAQQKTPML